MENDSFITGNSLPAPDFASGLTFTREDEARLGTEPAGAFLLRVVGCLLLMVS